MAIAVITGASSGMGREFVRQIAEKYPKLQEIWVIARRKERLEELKSMTPVRLRIFDYDLTKERSIWDLKRALYEKKPKIKLLVNAAGYGKIGHFRELTYQDNAGMIELNCRGLTAVTYACLPYMLPNGRIIQLASSAAFLPQPNFAVYAASKSYVLSFSRALGRELRDQKITVTAVCPGPVDTEFFDVAEQKGQTAYVKKLAMAKAPQVVAKALKDAACGKEMSVYGALMKGIHLAAKILPHRVLLSLMGIIF